MKKISDKIKNKKVWFVAFNIMVMICLFIVTFYIINKTEFMSNRMKSNNMFMPFHEGRIVISLFNKLAMLACGISIFSTFAFKVSKKKKSIIIFIVIYVIFMYIMKVLNSWA